MLTTLPLLAAFVLAQAEDTPPCQPSGCPDGSRCPAPDPHCPSPGAATEEVWLDWRPWTGVPAGRDRQAPCARRPEHALLMFAQALRQDDPTLLASAYDWRGMRNHQASAQLDALMTLDAQGWWEHTVVAAWVGHDATPRQAPRQWRWLSETQAATLFELRSQAGCWFLQSTEDPQVLHWQRIANGPWTAVMPVSEPAWTEEY